MKRLVILTMFVVLGLSLSGCCRTWPRWSWYRGDPCTTCQPSETMPMVGQEFYAAPPAAAEVLPGPVETESST